MLPTDHPANRPVEPEHPMALEGSVIDGDTAFMFRCMVEELLRSGVAPDEIRRMTGEPEYQGLYAARRALGPRAERILDDAAASVGRLRSRIWESRDQFSEVVLTVSADRAHQGA